MRYEHVISSHGLMEMFLCAQCDVFAPFSVYTLIELTFKVPLLKNTVRLIWIWRRTSYRQKGSGNGERCAGSKLVPDPAQVRLAAGSMRDRMRPAVLQH